MTSHSTLRLSYLTTYALSATAERRLTGDTGLTTVSDSPSDGDQAPVSLSAAAEGDSDQEAPATASWSGTLVLEGELTGDGRMILPDALTWDTLPLTLRAVTSDVGGHDGAEAVGRINTIQRDGAALRATGDFDLASEAGREAYRRVSQRISNGVSVDLDNVAFEVRVAKDVLDEQASMLEDMLAQEENDSDAKQEEPEQEVDEDGRVTVVQMDPDDEVMVTTSARIRAATLVDIPAFESARLEADEPSDDQPSTAPSDQDQQEPESVVASGISAPRTPPAEWFSDPGLDTPTALTVDRNGRIYGHVATWGSCHIGEPEGPGICTQPPNSPSDYAYFHTGEVLTDGGPLPCGRITLNTGHARAQDSASAALAHYDNTGTGVADVRAGEDSVGIWIAGALRPSVSEKDRRALRSSPLSGDWRRIGGALEMVAALAVNTAGFPIPRPHGLAASAGGEQQTVALVASGMLPPVKVVAPGRPGALSTEDLHYLKRLARREKAAHLSSLSRRAHVTAMANRRHNQRSM